MNMHEVIRGPMVITEKAAELKDEQRTLCFRVAVTANKTEIKGAVEKLFGVKVESVRTLRMNGKMKRYGRFEGKSAELEKSLRHAARGRKNDRVLRGGLIDDGSQEVQPHIPGTAVLYRPEFRRDHRDEAAQVADPVQDSKSGGRNDNGRITVRFRGGGHKQALSGHRFQAEQGRRALAKVASVEYDPNRSARIARIHYVDGEKAYIIQPGRAESR